jgi:hypothetical protein
MYKSRRYTALENLDDNVELSWVREISKTL